METLTFDLNYDLQRIIDIAAVADWLDVRSSEVMRMADCGELPGRFVNGQWLFGVATLNLWLEGRSLEQAVVQVARGHIGRGPGGQIAFAFEDPPTVQQMEDAYIRWVLDSVEHNKSRAADVLGLDPSTLYRKLARLQHHD